MDTTAGLTTHVDTAKCVATTPIPSGILPTDGMPHLGRTEDTKDIEDCTLSELMHKHTVFNVHALHLPIHCRTYGISYICQFSCLALDCACKASTKASNVRNKWRGTDGSVVFKV